MKRNLFRRISAYMAQQYHQNKILFSVYFILRISVIVIMVAQFFNGNYYDVLICLLTLTLFMIPSFFERRIKIDVPDTLEIIILLFIFAAEIFGEIGEYYESVGYWDTALHTINGFLCGAIGVSMIDILNRNNKFAFSMSPIFVALVAFCFSMTIGVLWEFFEFGMDMIFKTDMQRDTIINTISSYKLSPFDKNVTAIVQIESVVINGEVWDGYLDIGLLDTMKDLLVNFIGALAFSVIGYFYVKSRGRGQLVKRLLLKRITGNGDPEPASKSEDSL